MVETVPEGLKPEGASKIQGSVLPSRSRSYQPALAPVHSGATGAGILILRERSGSDFFFVLIFCRQEKKKSNSKLFCTSFLRAFIGSESKITLRTIVLLPARIVSLGGHVWE